MPKVTFIAHDGAETEVHVTAGVSLMQAALDNGVDGIIGECGGSCSCATCHCYIADAWVDKVSPASDTEKDMLDCVLEPKDSSRLSCQVVVDDSLDGLVVTLPKDQY